MQNDWIPVIFPEGTRSKDGSVGTFHAAGFRRFVDRCPLPVGVFAIDGGWRISKLGDMRKTLRGGRYRIKLLKVVITSYSIHYTKLYDRYKDFPFFKDFYLLRLALGRVVNLQKLYAIPPAAQRFSHIAQL